jgi:hypothetical protein
MKKQTVGRIFLIRDKMFRNRSSQHREGLSYTDLVYDAILQITDHTFWLNPILQLFTYTDISLKKSNLQ